MKGHAHANALHAWRRQHTMQQTWPCTHLRQRLLAEVGAGRDLQPEPIPKPAILIAEIHHLVH